MREEKQHWLVRPETIRRLRIGSGVVLGLVLVADAVVVRHPHFAVEGVFAFYAWYGFLTCAIMVLSAKLAGRVLKRKDSYYDD